MKNIRENIHIDVPPLGWTHRHSSLFLNENHPFSARWSTGKLFASSQNPNIFLSWKLSKLLRPDKSRKYALLMYPSITEFFPFFQWLFMPRRSFEHFVSLLQYCPRFLVVSFHLMGILFFYFPHHRSTRRYVDSVLFMSRLDAREAYLA